jgi:hypothetical protein
MHGGYFQMHPDGKETLPPLVKTPETESYSSVVTWDFPERGSHPRLRLHWYDGGMRPHRPVELDASKKMPGEGVLYVGTKGKLLTGYYGGRPLLLPDKQFKDFQRPAKTLPRSIGHYREWIQAAKGGKPATCNFELGGRMVEVALLGTLAARTARYLQWDAAKLAITNDAEANQLVNPPYREGWKL